MLEASEQPVKTLSLAELEPLIREVFQSGQTFQLPVTGTSNLPTLSGSRDYVILDQVERPLRKCDLPLYQRDSGQYVLHRIVSVQKDGTFTCCGDNQWKKEAGLRPDQVVGVTVGLIRKGRAFTTRQIGYRLWVRTWVFLLPCRKTLFQIRHGLSKLKHRLTKR
jgi:hypothetical protein